MQTTVTLTTKQLELIRYAASEMAVQIQMDLKEGNTGGYDMPRSELKQMAAGLSELDKQFRDLHHKAWVADMEERDKLKHGA